jgi:glycosidase
VNIDPYASAYDKTQMEKGWFASSLADLNLQNPLVLKYMIQNTIWWVEYAGIDGIRMDTYPYPNKQAMVEWRKPSRNTIHPLLLSVKRVTEDFAHSLLQSGTRNYDEYVFAHSCCD